MRSNRVLGVIFSNTESEAIKELTKVRTIGSVQFGGRYRLIDFVLSSMVNSGIDKVGVITKRNYQSLLDHLGSGKAWDLSRKNEGLYMLPPFGLGGDMTEGKVGTLDSNETFFRHSKEDYVLLSDSDVIINIDFQKVFAAHLDSDADITVVYANGVIPKPINESVVFKFDGESKVTDMRIGYDKDEACNYSLKMYLMKKEYMMNAVHEAVRNNKLNFVRDIIAPCFEKGRLYGYKHEGYSSVIGSMKQYFDTNMDMMKPEVRTEIFGKSPVYTKVRDEMPAVYGLGSSAHNSLVADGCTVDGEIENCVLFRGVTIEAGAKLSNCIVMQDSYVGANAKLDHVVIDKNTRIKAGRTMIGADTYPVFIPKGEVV